MEVQNKRDSGTCEQHIHQQLVVPDVHIMNNNHMDTAQPGQGIMLSGGGDLMTGKDPTPAEKSAALAATAFIHELSGLPPVPSDTLAAAMAAAAAAVGSSLNQIVPSSLPTPFPTNSNTGVAAAGAATSGTSTVAAIGPDVKLSPSQLGELELARQRAQRAAAGRRQQLIAQKRARETAQQQKAAAQEAKRPTRAAARGVAKLVTAAVDSSDEAEDSDEPYEAGGNGSTGDASKDARKLKRLLRNRVSAQQARERKKQYVTTLEDQVKELQSKIKELESSLRDQEQQNDALRRIIRNMRAADPAGGAPHALASAPPQPPVPAPAPPAVRAGTGLAPLEPKVEAPVLPDSISPQGSLQLGSSLPAPGDTPMRLEGTDTSQDPGYGASLHRVFASPVGAAGAFDLARNSSLDMFNMDLGDLEEDEDGLVVPQAPPLQELQGLTKPPVSLSDHDLLQGSESPEFPMSS